MRTGLGSPGNAVLYPNDEYFIKRAVALAAVVTTRAADTACTLAEHQGRTGVGAVTVPHIHAAMQYQAMNLMKSDDLEEDVDATEKALWEESSSEEECNQDTAAEDLEHDDIYADMPDLVSDTDSDNSPKRGFEKPEELYTVEEAVSGSCDCTVCAGVKHAVRHWDAWEPDDEVEKYMKHVVETKVLNT